MEETHGIRSMAPIVFFAIVVFDDGDVLQTVLEDIAVHECFREQYARACARVNGRQGFGMWPMDKAEGPVNGREWLARGLLPSTANIRSSLSANRSWLMPGDGSARCYERMEERANNDFPVATRSPT